MTLSGSLRRYLLVLLLTGSALALGSPQQPQKKSPKELMKEAQADEQHDQWQAAVEKLQKAAALKPKDKNIALVLKTAREHTANLTANQAIASCNELKIDACEQQVKLALSYARTPRAADAENQLVTCKAELQKRWDQAEQMIASRRLDEANVEMEALSQFPYLFPTLAAEKQRLRSLRISAALELGGKDLAAYQFDEAKQAFTAALRLDPGNAEAVRGVGAAEKGKEAFLCYQQAQNALTTKEFEAAYLSNQKALGLFPDRQEYQNLDKQISTEWLKVLEDTRGLNPSPGNVKENQKAWQSIQWIKRLDPNYQGLGEASHKIAQNLYSGYIQKASQYQGRSNNSGVAVAYLYNLNAQRINLDPSSEEPFAASMREVSSLFTRKRSMTILVSVKNLTPVVPGFMEAVVNRVRAAIEALGLPDLKVQLRDEYEKNPTGDPLFQENRPDGKSPIALVSVNVTGYEQETSGENSPEEKHSKYNVGQETVSNPEHEKAVQQYKVASDSLARKHKAGKPTKDGYTDSDKVVYQQEMNQTPPTITRDKIQDYTYQEYHLSARAHVAMNLVIRDMLGKQSLGSDEVESSREDKATEIAGVQSKDVNGLINRPARIKTPEQLLREAELDALTAVDEKVQGLLSRYVERYYQEGEKALADGRTIDAAENFICYWYTFRGVVDEKRSQHIREVVKVQTGLELNTPESLPASD